ncbi:hypothetical protein KP509_19G054200 [Ceratopteris richardii]|uniref:Uncharacterized protein n=1 Tax=Ceratopteris richardii TaxID=49495 RepID=A0A8T2SKB3_CERRI|nr:hypothetical protein KP509_19G054200 [Ceratopteris richardii]
MAFDEGTGSALHQLHKTLNEERYKLSKREIEAFEKCRNKGKSRIAETFLTAGTVLWAVTGRLRLVERLAASFSGASIGAYLALRFSTNQCMEDLLGLEGSHVQERLAEVLRSHAIKYPSARKMLEKYYYLEPLYDDSGQETSSFALRKRETNGVSLHDSLESVDHYEKKPDGLREKAMLDSNNGFDVMPGKSLSNDSRDHAGNQLPTHDDGFGFPWNEAWETNNPVPDKMQKHKGRMTVLERREYNRARYLEWEEKRKASRPESEQAEL